MDYKELTKGSLLALVGFLAPLGMQLIWNTDMPKYVGIIVLLLAAACAFGREILKRLYKS